MIEVKRRALGVAGLVCIALMLGAADWPTYLGGEQREGESSEAILSPSNAGQLTQALSYKTGGIVAASASVVNGVAYFGSWDGYEYAINAATGATVWRTYLGVTTTTCKPVITLGVTSSATILNGVVYVGGGNAYWYALDATTGKVLWKVFTGDNSPSGGHYNWSSPLIHNGYAYIGIASLDDCPLVQGQLLQVSLSTRKVVHTFDVVPVGQVGGSIWSSPAVDSATNTVYVTTGNGSTSGQTYAEAILALDASTLRIKDHWQLPAGQAITDGDWGTTPSLFTDEHGRTLVAAINKNGYVYAWKRSTLAGGYMWRTQIAVGGPNPGRGQGSVSSTAFGGGTLYAAGGNTTIKGVAYPGGVRALDPATGAIRWQHGAPGVVLPALAYDNGLVIDGAGSTMEVLNASTGARLYKYTVSGPFEGAPSISDTDIFMGSVDGHEHVFSLARSAAGFLSRSAIPPR